MTKITLLIVEDESSRTHREKELLENSGYSIVAANSAEDAAEKVKTEGRISLAIISLSYGSEALSIARKSSV